VSDWPLTQFLSTPGSSGLFRHFLSHQFRDDGANVPSHDDKTDLYLNASRVSRAVGFQRSYDDTKRREPYVDLVPERKCHVYSFIGVMKGRGDVSACVYLHLSLRMTCYLMDRVARIALRVVGPLEVPERMGLMSVYKRYNFKQRTSMKQ
jgi:hypothetical protein